MNGFLLALIIYICLFVALGGLIAFNIVMRIVKKSNMAGECKSDYYNNTKQPIRMHVFSWMERVADSQENPEYYKKAEEE
jgi:hypothetical protein